MSFIKLDRKILNSSIWNAEPASKLQAWIDMLLSASYKDSFFFVKGSKVNVARGQLAMSQITMTKRWQWSRGKVKRFLNDLQNERMIEQQTGHLTTIISICNYEVYQGQGLTDGTTDSTTHGTADGTADGTHSRNKEVKNNNIEDFVIQIVERGVAEERVREWLKIRGKASNTESALKKQLSNLDQLIEQGVSAEKVFRVLTENGWKGIKPTADYFMKELGAAPKNACVTSLSDRQLVNLAEQRGLSSHGLTRDALIVKLERTTELRVVP